MQKHQMTGFGMTADGKEAHLYTLENKNGMKACVSDLGAVLVNLFVPDKDGKLTDVVLGYDSAEGYINGSGALGAVVGRNANRIGGAEFDLNGVHYELAKNDNGKKQSPQRTGLLLINGSGRQKNLDRTTSRFCFTVPTGTRGIPGRWICM